MALPTVLQKLVGLNTSRLMGMQLYFHTSARIKGQKKWKKHPENPQFVDEYTTNPPKGKIFDKKPFQIELQAGKKYYWCLCGASKTQPFCDGSHKVLWGYQEIKTDYKWQPLNFTVDETKNYWLCNCKQSNNRPFCDGTHKQEHIQRKIR